MDVDVGVLSKDGQAPANYLAHKVDVGSQVLITTSSSDGYLSLDNGSSTYISIGMP